MSYRVDRKKAENNTAVVTARSKTAVFSTLTAACRN